MLFAIFVIMPGPGIERAVMIFLDRLQIPMHNNPSWIKPAPFARPIYIGKLRSGKVSSRDPFSR